MLRVLERQPRKRAVHPQGDAMYRAAAVAAALMAVTAAPPLWILGGSAALLALAAIKDGFPTNQSPHEHVAQQ